MLFSRPLFIYAGTAYQFSILNSQFSILNYYGITTVGLKVFASSGVTWA